MGADVPEGVDHQLQGDILDLRVEPPLPVSTLESNGVHVGGGSRVTRVQVVMNLKALRSDGYEARIKLHIKRALLLWDAAIFNVIAAESLLFNDNHNYFCLFDGWSMKQRTCPACCDYLDKKLSAAATGMEGRSTVSDQDDWMIPSSIFTRIRSSVSCRQRSISADR